MPILKSAKKRLRQNKKRERINKVFKDKMKESVKKIRSLVKSGKISEAEKDIPNTYKSIDKAAKKGVIKEKTADRKKSRLSTLINKSRTEK